MKASEANTNNMDMPCMCSCGNWFDLNDGYADGNSSNVVCKDCHNETEDWEDFQNALYDLNIQIDNGEIGKREGKRQIKELTNKYYKNGK